MKRILMTLLMAATVLCAFAKNDAAKSVVNSFTFYGVNYSKSHIFAFNEDAEKTVNGLSEVNGLFISEMGKYDLAKFLKKKVERLDVEVAAKQTRDMAPENLATLSEGDRLSKDTIAAVIKNLELKETSGYGLMIFGDLLNKKDNMATYQYVYFDIATREIVEMQEVAGAAGGFGYRNYWA